ncbi:MAG: tetratricopeptide repeat protein [Acidobacteriia bacterium]|nr:tetratricopeptide repeat protein [Terriglobia bacterium]
MPSRLSSRKPAPNAAVDETTEKSYQKLLAFLDLASGSTFAIARCNLPSLRKEILQRVATDAAAKSVTVKEVDISSNYSGDFVAAVITQLDGLPTGSRIAVMLNGIDGLIYQSARQENLLGEGRTPFIARLNFDRERIARDLPCPIVFWLESESLTLLLKQAPDFTQWISGHFHFGGPAAEAKALDQLMEGYKSLPSQPATETRKQLEEFSGLLQELNETRGRGDAVTLRKRLAVLNALGERYFRLSDARMAQKYCIEALEVSRKLNDRRAESGVLGNLGLAYSDLGETRRAIELYEQSLAIEREIGDRRGEGNTLGSLGTAYQELGETRRAIELYEQALPIHRKIGNRQGEGNTLGNLGLAYSDLGETRRAIELYEQSLAIKRGIGDRLGEGNALGNLGLAYSDLGETRRAIELYEQALAIHREIGDRRREGNALGNLGSAYSDLGETRRAVEFYRQALAIHREISNRRGEGTSLGNLGVAYTQLGEPRRAIEFYEQQLAITREIGDRRGEGNALGNMAVALDELSDRAQAIATAEAALKIYEEIESPNAAKVRQQLAAWGR